MTVAEEGVPRQGYQVQSKETTKSIMCSGKYKEFGLSHGKSIWVGRVKGECGGQGART